MRKLVIIFFILSLLFPFSAVNTAPVNFQPEKITVENVPQDFKVEFFPVAPYHIGDLISVRVTYTGTGDIADQEIQLSLVDQTLRILGTENFNDHSKQAVFYWILDTEAFDPGYNRFIFEIPGINLSWQEGIHLLPAIEDDGQKWASVTTNCCAIYFIEGSDAAQDISQIQKSLEETVNSTLNALYPAGVDQENSLEGEIKLVLVPAIIGHGGYASDMAVVTYTDRNWVGSSFKTISHHEIVHVFDRKFNDDNPRPSILSEGIAVYLSGGHYRDGDPLLRASALLGSGQYIPLENLANDFYNAQHEIAYMEGAALVAYMVELWGWESFLDFYFNLEERQSDSATISTSLENKFGFNFVELESQFTAYLNSLEPEESIKSDVRLTIEVYDMIRRYQSVLIPSAHFQTAWWPSIERMLEMGITDDYDSREKTPLNIILENRLIKIQETFEKQDYQQIEEHLNFLATHLDNIDNSSNSPSHYDLGWWPFPDFPHTTKRP